MAYLSNRKRQSDIVVRTTMTTHFIPKGQRQSATPQDEELPKKRLA